MGRQSEGEGARHTALGSPCVQGLWSERPVHREVLTPGWTSLRMSCWGLTVLNAELKLTNSILTRGCLVSSGGEWQWR